MVSLFHVFVGLIDVRQNNLSLLQTYGPNAWRIHNYLLEATAKQTEKALEELKDMTVEVNRQRKNDQVRVLEALAMNKKNNLNGKYRIDLESS